MKSASKDIISGVAIFGLSIAIFTAGTNIEPILPVGVGSGFAPKIVGALLAAISVVVIVNGYKSIKRTDERIVFLNRDQIRAVLATLVLIGLYVSLLETIGFVLTTIPYLFGQFLVLAPSGQRSPIQFATISVVVAITVYFTFVYLFDLILPVGFLG